MGPVPPATAWNCHCVFLFCYTVYMTLVACVELQVHENEPVRLEGVVRSADRKEDVIGKRGTIKSLAGRFATATKSRDSDSSSDDDDPARRRPPPRRPGAPGGAGGSDAVVLSENVPAEQDPSIVRSTGDGYDCEGLYPCMHRRHIYIQFI